MKRANVNVRVIKCCINSEQTSATIQLAKGAILCSNEAKQCALASVVSKVTRIERWGCGWPGVSNYWYMPLDKAMGILPLFVPFGFVALCPAWCIVLSELHTREEGSRGHPFVPHSHSH